MDFTKFSIATQPQIDSIWTNKDYFGALKVRFSIKRNNYRVKPGLYKLGKPGKDAEVIVTSNYKLTFDTVRRSLKGINVWVFPLWKNKKRQERRLRCFMANIFLKIGIVFLNNCTVGKVGLKGFDDSH